MTIYNCGYCASCYKTKNIYSAYTLQVYTFDKNNVKISSSIMSTEIYFILS